MLLIIGIGALMLFITTAIHGAFMTITIKALRAYARRRARGSRVRPVQVVTSAILLMFAASLLEVGAWATTYLLLGAFSALEPAIYFSMVTFTTLGYGDIVLDGHWRVLASFEAANGIIMFGWTTAVVFAVVQRVYVPEVRVEDP
ncbi:MAG: potassium channel family protein [Acidobacteriota bacterium]|jgi:hypothetical protein